MDFSIGSSGFWQAPGSGFVYEQAVSPKPDYPFPTTETAQDAEPSDSLSIFPSFFAKQHSDNARQRVLASVDNKDQYRIAPMLKKDQALALIKKLTDELARLNDVEVNDMLLILFKSINPLPDQEIPIEQWATLSIRLELLMGMLKKHPDARLPSLSYIKFIVRKLEYVCRHTWKQQAYEQIIKKFTQLYVHLICTNPTLSYVRTAKGTAEIGTPLDFMSVSGSAGCLSSINFDDELYLITTEADTGDLALNFNVPFAKFKAQASGARGNYSYTRTARHHAVCNFEQLLESNCKSPEIARYLSRRNTIGVGDNANEMQGFYAAQKNNLLNEKSAANAFSVFLSLDYSQISQRHTGARTASDSNGNVIPNIEALEPLPQTISPNATPVYAATKKRAIAIKGTTETATGTVSISPMLPAPATGQKK